MDLLYLPHLRLPIIALRLAEMAVASLLTPLLASLRAREVADLLHILLLVDQVDGFVVLDEEIDFWLFELVERVIGDESDLEEIA